MFSEHQGFNFVSDLLNKTLFDQKKCLKTKELQSKNLQKFALKIRFALKLS